ncbi:hypothetical protein FRC07_015174 [Ceratobasidium sp. 392]|nr:hypothetical protein FRC07_015174 [Ceratobasidium sp. 392]
MLLLQPAVIALAVFRFFIPHTFVPNLVPAYIGIAAGDAGVRLAQIATYHALSRSGLQLPASAFMPAAQPIGASDITLYAAPVALTGWPSSADVVQYVQAAATTIRHYVSRTSHVLRRRVNRYIKLFVPGRPNLTLASERARAPYELGYSNYYNQSLFGQLPPTVPIAYPTLLPIPAFLPVLVAISPHPLDICTLLTLSACPVGGHQLSTIPSVLRPITSTAVSLRPSYALSLKSSDRLRRSPSPVAQVSFADLEGLAVGFLVPAEPGTIIHVRNCLVIGLPLVLCLVYICFICLLFVYRLATRLVRVTRDFVCAQVCCTIVRGLTSCWKAGSCYKKTVKLIVADVCGRTRYTTGSEGIVVVTPLAQAEVEVEVPVQDTTTRTKGKKKKAKSKGKGRKIESMDARSPLIDETPSIMKSEGEMAAVEVPVEDDGDGWMTVTKKQKATARARPDPTSSSGGKSKRKAGRGKGRK